MEAFCYVEQVEGGLDTVKLQPVQKRVLLDITTRDAFGKFPYTTIVYSAPKKSGKTAIAAMFGKWFAFTEPAPNEVYVMANDLEQAQGRIFRSMWKSLYGNPATKEIVNGKPLPGKGQDTISLPNGTIIQALPNDYAGAAGSNHGLTIWSELWGYTSENMRRLWDELTPVPTRKNSIRFVETYAGFLDESTILEELYTRMVKARHERYRDEYRRYKDGFELDGEWYDISLPVYVDEESSTYVYWDEEPRMPWQTPAYYATEKKTLRPSAYFRLHKNQWVAGESTFVTEEMWNACEKPLDDPIWERATDLDRIAALDASVKKDGTGIVVVSYDADRNMYFVRQHKLWMPERNAYVAYKVVDLEETLKKTVEEWSETYELSAIYYDPYQLHSIAMALLKDGYDMREFSQGVSRTKADAHLYDMITQGRLVVYPSVDLKAHVIGAKTKEYEDTDRLRLIKGKGKIDLAVCLSSAMFGSVEYYREHSKKWSKMKEFLSISTKTNQSPFGGNNGPSKNRTR